MSTLKRNLSRERIKSTFTASLTSAGHNNTDINALDHNQMEREMNSERLKRVSSSSSISSTSKHNFAY